MRDGTLEGSNISSFLQSCETNRTEALSRGVRQQNSRPLWSWWRSGSSWSCLVDMWKYLVEKLPRVIYSALSMQTALYRGFSPSGYHQWGELHIQCNGQPLWSVWQRWRQSTPGSFVFKWPFKCSSCHYNNINNCFYQVIWPDRLWLYFAQPHT